MNLPLRKTALLVGSLALGTALLAGCGGSKSTVQTPNAPGSPTTSAPATAGSSSSSSSGGGYGY